jgi:hypothetical protein
MRVQLPLGQVNFVQIPDHLGVGESLSNFIYSEFSGEIVEIEPSCMFTLILLVPIVTRQKL